MRGMLLIFIKFRLLIFRFQVTQFMISYLKKHSRMTPLLWGKQCVILLCFPPLAYRQIVLE